MFISEDSFQLNEGMGPIKSDEDIAEEERPPVEPSSTYLDEKVGIPRDEEDVSKRFFF